MPAGFERSQINAMGLNGGRNEINADPQDPAASRTEQVFNPSFIGILAEHARYTAGVPTVFSRCATCILPAYRWNPAGVLFVLTIWHCAMAMRNVNPLIYHQYTDGTQAVYRQYTGRIPPVCHRDTGPPGMGLPHVAHTRFSRCPDGIFRFPISESGSISKLGNWLKRLKPPPTMAGRSSS